MNIFRLVQHSMISYYKWEMVLCEIGMRVLTERHPYLVDSEETVCNEETEDAHENDRNRIVVQGRDVLKETTSLVP